MKKVTLFTKKTVRNIGLVVMATASSAAFATGEVGGVDVSGAVTIIGGITAAIAAIGAAKLAPAATAVAFKWAKGSLFS